MSIQSQTPSIAVVLHLSNLNIWPHYLTALKDLPTHTSFFVTTTLDQQEAVTQLVQKDLAQAHFFAFENRGRDFGALISLLEKVPLHEFDFVLKLHTGNTEYYSEISNEQWLLELVNRLLPKGRLNLILNHLQNDPLIGLMGPRENHWSLKKLFFNEDTVKHWNKLTSIRNLSVFPEDPYFIAGGMFWARGSIFKGFTDLKLSQSQFELNTQVLDGTLAHALERYVCLIAHDQNLKVEGVDFSDFSHWLSQRTITEPQRKQFKTYIASSHYLPKVQIIVQCQSNENNDALALSLQSIEIAKQCGMQVETQVWQETNPSPLRRFAVDQAQVNFCDWLLIIKAGDELTQCGLLMAYVEMIKHPDQKAIYTDKMLRAPGGSIETAFLPDFNHDLLVSFPWLMSNHWFFKLDSLLEHKGFDESAGEFFELAYIFSLLATNGHSHIHHLAEPLLITPEPKAWIEEPQERAIVEKYIIDLGYPNGQVLQLSPRLYRALYLQETLPLVSIVIPNQDFQLTQRCLESLLQNTGYNHYEVLIVDNHSKDEASIAWLQGIGAIDPQRFRIVTNNGPTDIYAMNNTGAQVALGDFIVFVDPSVHFIESSWLDSLINHGQRPNVGAVGVKVVDSSLNVYSAGLVICMIKGKENAFAGERYDAIGYLQRLSVDQGYSAISSKCVMVRKSHFESVGGFKVSIESNTETDIDFCLKLKAKELDNIWTPYAVVQFSPLDSSIKKSTTEGYLPSDAFLSEWLPAFANDPAYNKNFSFVAKPFSVESLSEINWRPLSWRPLPVILAHPSDDTGCGQYRVIKPLSSMMQEGTVDGLISYRALVPAELEKLQPNTIVFQRPLAREFLDYMNNAKIYSNAFKVYEIDDLITNIPIKNYFKTAHPKDTVKLLREGIAQVDRLIVSTPGLADAYSGWHSDTRVLELKLPTIWWSNLSVNRTEHKKPRVGWAGGSSHLGDLELIADVVKELADEVDWIFFGMCPKKLRPYIKEFHSGVPIHMYPQKLASLDLDLALAPLENNQFNDCKSNLRLLEYGACGYPVICSNTRAFVECKLPVQIVKNKFKDWTSAIRSHINDIEASRLRGMELASQVRAEWILEDTSLDQWKAMWAQDLNTIKLSKTSNSYSKNVRLI
jgi:glycosyltransferase involved in cell wall biosynthesis